MTDIFKQAVKKKLLFVTPKGAVTVQQLFDMKLSSADGFNLDEVAKLINTELKKTGEESFVSETVSPAAADLQLRLDVVKEIIADKIAEAAANRNAAAKSAERQRLLALLDEKSNEELKSLSKEELQKRLDELN